MDLQSLKSVCRLGENQQVEFKKNANHPDQIVEEIVGFANAGGGNLYVGVDDSGEVTGLKFVEDDVTFLRDYIAQKIIPQPAIQYDIIPVSKKRAVIALSIEPGKHKPYSFIKGPGGPKKIFYRVEDQCLQASRELKNILRGSTRNRGQVIQYTELEDRILKAIDEQGRVSKDWLTGTVDFPSRKVSDCLVRLVIAGVLKIIPTTEGDFYEYQHSG